MRKADGGLMYGYWQTLFSLLIRAKVAPMTISSLVSLTMRDVGRFIDCEICGAATLTGPYLGYALHIGGLRYR
jgi:hypothetical protein